MTINNVLIYSYTHNDNSYLYITYIDPVQNLTWIGMRAKNKCCVNIAENTIMDCTIQDSNFIK